MYLTHLKRRICPEKKKRVETPSVYLLEVNILFDTGKQTYFSVQVKHSEPTFSCIYEIPRLLVLRPPHAK